MTQLRVSRFKLQERQKQALNLLVFVIHKRHRHSQTNARMPENDEHLHAQMLIHKYSMLEIQRYALCYYIFAQILYAHMPRLEKQ